MAVVLIIILGFFGVCILLGLIQAVYYKTVETIESRKIDKKIYEEQVVVNKIKGNANNVQSNERIYFSNGFYV